MSDVAEHSASVGKAISRSIVALHERYLGRGPDRAETYVHDDRAVVLMSAQQTGMELVDAMNNDLIAVIEAETGRSVIGCMSSSQQSASLLSLVFVFAPD